MTCFETLGAYLLGYDLLELLLRALVAVLVILGATAGLGVGPAVLLGVVALPASTGIALATLGTVGSGVVELYGAQATYELVLGLVVASVVDGWGLILTVKVGESEEVL
jgi:hypothetical protein